MTARTAAVITWFRPTARVLDGLAAARRDWDVVVVVDNTPGSAAHLQVPPDVVYLRSGSNLGLAAALNVGIASLPADVELVMLLDQDSVLPPGAAGRLVSYLQVPEVAVAAPVPWDAARGRAVDPLQRPAHRVVDRDVVITSGMLLRRRALWSVGAFREDFFVDAVDQDICLRLRRAGWRIVQDLDVHLDHELGEVTWRRFAGVTLRSTRHPAWRLYAAGRNGGILLREHLRDRPRWAVRQVGQLLYWLLTVLLLEPPRATRARALVTGFADGIRGRGESQPPAAALD